MDEIIVKFFKKIISSGKTLAFMLACVTVAALFILLLLNSGSSVENENVLYSILADDRQPIVTYHEEPIVIDIEVDLSGDEESFVLNSLTLEGMDVSFYSNMFFFIQDPNFQFRDSDFRSVFISDFFRTDEGFKFVSLCPFPVDTELILEPPLNQENSYDNYYIDNLLALHDDLDYVKGRFDIGDLSVPVAHFMSVFQRYVREYTCEVILDHNRKIPEHDGLHYTEISVEQGDVITLSLSGYYVVEYPCTQQEFLQIQEIGSYLDAGI